MGIGIVASHMNLHREKVPPAKACKAVRVPPLRRAKHPWNVEQALVATLWAMGNNGSRKITPNNKL